jgi:hypothetical protein
MANRFEKAVHLPRGTDRANTQLLETDPRNSH